MKRSDIPRIWSIASFSCFRDLPSFVVHFKFAPVDEFGNGDDIKPFVFQPFQDGIQYLRGVLGIVMEEDDGAVAQMFVVQHLIDLCLCSLLLPVQTVNTCNKNKGGQNP